MLLTSMRTKFFLFPVLLAAMLLAPGCAMIDDMLSAPTNKNPPAWVPMMPESQHMRSKERPLQQGDEVNIALHLPNNASAQPIADIVDSLGNVTLPLIGEVRVGGSTTSEAETVIRDAYVKGGFYNNVDVTVVCPTLQRENERTVSVTGCVGKRGEIPYRDGLTLREAIILAGDLTDFASGTILLTRNGKTESYDLTRIKRGRQQDPFLQPRDIIEARESRF